MFDSSNFTHVLAVVLVPIFAKVVYRQFRRHGPSWMPAAVFVCLPLLVGIGGTLLSYREIERAVAAAGLLVTQQELDQAHERMWGHLYLGAAASATLAVIVSAMARFVKREASPEGHAFEVLRRDAR